MVKSVHVGNAKHSFKHAAVLAALVGLTTFGAPAMAAPDFVYSNEGEIYSVSEGSLTDYNFYVKNDDGTLHYYKINYNFDNIDSTGTGATYSNTETSSTTGSKSIILPNNQSQNLYYTYTTPEGYTHTSSKVTSITAENVQNKEFTTNVVDTIYNTSPNGNVNIISNFVNNNVVYTGSSREPVIYIRKGSIGNINGTFVNNVINTSVHSGCLIKNNENTSDTTSMGNISGDFIGNGIVQTNTSKLDLNSAVIFAGSRATTGNISGNFIGNYLDLKDSQGFSACIRLYHHYGTSTVGNISGNFIGNYVSAGADATGAAITAGYYNSIGNISGNFIGNYVIGGGTVRGGAIYMYGNSNSGTEHVGTISGNFIGNYAKGTKSSATVQGGAIVHGLSTHNLVITESLKDSNFIANFAESSGSVYGGAIYNYGTFTNGIINTNFLNNYLKTSGNVSNAKGGAIYTGSNINFYANNNNTSTFSGNYIVGSNNEKLYEAIYVEGSSRKLTFNASTGGQFVLDDYINGTSGYDVLFTGDGTGTINLYNDVKNADLTTSNVTMNLQNSVAQTYNFRTLNSSSTAKWNLDINFQNNTSDNIITTNNSSGTVYINDINFYGLTGNEQEGYTQTVKILNTPSNALQLGINNALTSDVTLYSDTVSVVDDIEPNVRWNQEFGGYDETITLKGGFGLDTTSTTNDSLTMTITDRTDVKDWTDKYDTLKAWTEQTTTEDRNFNFAETGFDPQAKEYVVTKDLTTATSGNLNINGEVDTYGNILSTINAQDTGSVKHQLFTIGDDTTLTVNNVEIKNAKTDTAAIDNQSGIVNLNNVTFTSNTTDVNNNNELNITGGTVTINNGITGSGTTNISGKLVNNSTIQQDEIAITSTGELSSAQANLVTPSNTIKNDGTFNINENVITLNVTKNTLGTGTVNLNNANTNINSTISDNNIVFNGSVLTFSDPATNIANSNLTMNNGGLINLKNGTTDELGMQNLTLKNNTLINMDSDIFAGTMDSLKLSSFTNDSGNTLIINPNLPTNISTALTNDKIQMSPISDNSTMSESDRSLLASSIDMVMPEKIISPIYTYTPSYDSTTGMMTLLGGGSGDSGYNPAVLSEPVAAQANIMAINNIVTNYAFHHVDTCMGHAHGRLSSRYLNRYAIAETDLIKDDLNTNNPLFTEPDKEAVWVKPFVTFENIPLKNGPKVNNITYGTLIGFDSPVFHHKRGFDGVWTGYVGYNGSNMHYSGVDSTSNGGLFGATYSLYKGNFFNATTVTTGAMHTQARTMYGNDNMTSLYAGIGNKTGYNFNFKEGLFTIQPSFLISYTFGKTFDYTNAAGVRIDSDPSHAIQLSPGIKFFMNTKNGWQPYIGVNMMWNIMDQTHARANGVKLPEMSVKPYVQYGIGVQKVMKDHFTAYGQAMIQNGGRNGISLTFGFKWALGRDHKKIEKVENKKILKQSKLIPQQVRDDAKGQRHVLKG